jgi:hypothetical protein
MSVVKPNLGPHAGRVNNPLSFVEAYEQARDNPDRTYYTTGDRSVFVVKAAVSKKGNHPREPVLRFMSDRTERARAYECCWGHRTNCNSTHIDCYTRAIDG